MSDKKPNFGEFDDAPTVVGPELSSEATMVVESGPDLSSEATMVHDSLANPLAPLAKFVVLEGVQKDKEYPLIGTEITFGREKDNTISHPDLSVSRRHFKIENKGDQFYLVDLGGPNGTLHNNKKISNSRSKLKHGDQIQAGKTLLSFQFLDEAAAASGGGNQVVIGVSVALVLLLIAGVALYFVMSAKKPTVAVVDAGPATPPAPRITRAQILLQKGIGQKTEGNLLLAKTTFSKAKQLAKEGSLTKLQAKQLLDETIADIKVDNFLKQAEAQYQQGEYQEAKQLVEKAEKALPIGSSKGEQVWSLAFKIRLRLGGRNLTSELRKAKRLIRRRRFGQARQMLAQLQRAVDPGTKDAQKLIDLTNELNAKAPTPRRRRPKRRTTPSKGQTPVLKVEPVKPPTPQISQGLLFFNRGKLKEAGDAFAKENKADKAKMVKDFTKALVSGKSAYAVRNPVMAIPSLLRSNELDAKLSGGKSVFSPQIKIMLANMFFAKGRQAMSLRNFNGYATAFSQFNQAKRFNPKHAPSRSALKQLKDLAKNWFSKAKTLGKKSPEARRLLQNVQRVVQRSDKLYQDANQLLK